MEALFNGNVVFVFFFAVIAIYNYSDLKEYQIYYRIFSGSLQYSRHPAGDSTFVFSDVLLFRNPYRG